MNIKEKAKIYAEGKAFNAISAAIEEAYADGYNEGYNDGVKSRADDDTIGVVKFVNMDLKSGIEWSSGYVRDENNMVKFVTYEEALKYNIPTLEQFRELLKGCHLKYSYNDVMTATGAMILGTKGGKITLPYTCSLYKVKLPTNYITSASFMFWLKDEQEGNERLCVDSSCIKKGMTKKLFMGLKLPILVVRNIKM